MKHYDLKIEFTSDALPGSGEGLGAVIDTDIVFDKTGLPFIPAKRFKGCLRESANDVCHMLRRGQINSLGFPLAIENSAEEGTGKTQYRFVNELFGRPGREDSAPIYFSNITIRDYQRNADVLTYFQQEYPVLVSTESVVRTFTYLRQSTAIDEQGVADDHSLRTARVLKKGLEFKGSIRLPAEDTAKEQLLALACINLRRMGSKRRRGFGEMRCRLCQGDREITVDVSGE